MLPGAVRRAVIRSAVNPDDAGGRHRAVEALERQLADVLDLDVALELRDHPARDQDLAGLGLAAEPRGEVGDRADGAVVEPSLEADGADGGIALGDADAPGPARSPACATCRSARPRASRMATAMRTARAAASGTGTGSLKKIIMPSPVKRSSVPSCSRMSRPISAWYSRSTPMTSSGSAVSAKAVKPRRSRNTTAISRRCVLRGSSAPPARIASASWPARRSA